MMTSDDKVGGWVKKGQNHDDVILECPLRNIVRFYNEGQLIWIAAERNSIIHLTYYERAQLGEFMFEIAILFLWMFTIYPKLYIPSTLNTDCLLWQTQLIVCAVKY